MKTTNYSQTAKYNGNTTTYFLNFENNTYAKVVVTSIRQLKRFSFRANISGNYDKKLINVDIDSLGKPVVFPISQKKAEVGQVLTHEIFGKVEVVSKNGQILKIKLENGTDKMVSEPFFMNKVA